MLNEAKHLLFKLLRRSKFEAEVEVEFDLDLNLSLYALACNSDRCG
jgi:hypothetical protein